MKSLQMAVEYKPETIRMRRWLHQHAELSFQEYQTTDYIVQELEKIGIPSIRPHTTGVIGVIQGSKPGKTIGLRAAIDGLPIQENNRLDYRSLHPGVMHAFGHDFHTASLLMAGRILWEMRDTFEGTIKLIFQPCEEGAESGALAMMEKGDLEDCDAFVSLLVDNSLPVGSVSVDPGPRMAASSGLYITVHGTGGHGGSPWEAVDPITAAAAVIMDLQPMLTREFDPHHLLVVSIGTIHGGTMKNIIPETVEIEGTIRFYEPSLEEQFRESITRIVQHVCAAYRCEVDVRVSDSFPAVINDPQLTALADQTAAMIWGRENMKSLPSSMVNDDFAFYGTAKNAPLLYAIVGGANPEKECDYPHHHPSFDVDEDAIVETSAFFSQLALDFLNT